MNEARRAEALARERERAETARDPRPLWMIVLGFLVGGFAVQRGSAAAIAFSTGLPAPVWFALGVECAVGVALSVVLWVGSRTSVGAAVALGIASALSAVAQLAALGTAAAPAVVARALVGLLLAGALVYGLRRHFAVVGRLS